NPQIYTELTDSSLRHLDCPGGKMDGDMKQPEDDAQSIQLIKQPDQTKERKKGGDADSGNSEEDDKKEEEEKCCSDDAQNTEQPEDTNTEVHNQQKESEKDTTGVSGQSDDQLDLDTTDGKSTKPRNEHNEVLQGGEGLRKRSPNKNQKIEHKGEGDHIETTRIRATTNTSTQNTEQPEDTDTEVHNQQKESEKELKGDGDNIETIGIPATADTSTQDTEQPEDTDTEVHNQQKESEKDTIGVSGQSDDQLDLDMTDGKSIKPRNENNEVLQAGEGLRKRSSKNQKIEHKGEGDNIEAIGITDTS
ncbi:torsin-1A-interacting protein 2-like isoform X1, partial [Clarias magur]